MCESPFATSAIRSTQTLKGSQSRETRRREAFEPTSDYGHFNVGSESVLLGVLPIEVRLRTLRDTLPSTFTY